MRHKDSEQDSGVSPAIAVVLMLAITVILAVLIGSAVLDLGGEVEQKVQASVQFDELQTTAVEVKLDAVQQADYIYVISSAGNVSANSPGGVGPGGYTGKYADGNRFLLSDSNGGVGTTVTVQGGAYAEGEKITVIGVYEDASEVIQTYTMGGSS